MKLLNLFTSLLPWIAFSILFSLYPSLALPAAIVLSLLFCYPKLRKGFILEWGSLLFFISLFIDYQIFKNLWLIRHISIFISFFFVAVSFISLLIKRPFTLQYAKLEVDKKLWGSPYFLRANQIMTAVLGFIFLFMGLANLYRTYFGSGPNRWIVWGIGLAIQIIFLDRFPKWYRKKHFKKEKKTLIK